MNQDSTKGVPAKNQKQGKTEDRGPLPSDQKFHFADDYARGFKDGLNEHHAILEEIRKELDSTRNANTVFTWLYAILAALLFGAGAFSTKNVFEGNKAVAQAREEVASARDEVSEFMTVRKAVVSELHDYLKRFPIKEGMLAPGTIGSLQRAVLHEIDHITFLANPFFRFRKPETREELELYGAVLLTTARWHLAEDRFADGLMRLENFFSIWKNSNSHKDVKLLARACSYRAFACMGLLAEQQKEPILETDGRNRKIAEYRQTFEENIKKAKQLDPTWVMSYIWEGLYVSLNPQIPSHATEEQSRMIQKSAQERAIEIYREIVRRGSELEPDNVFVAKQNICCCLKRIGDTENDYQPLFLELESIPDERRLRERYGDISTEDNAKKLGFWRRILTDDVFFNSVSGDREEYGTHWVELVSQKAQFTDWRKFCKRMCSQQPSMLHWQIKLWELPPT